MNLLDLSADYHRQVRSRQLGARQTQAHSATGTSQVVVESKVSVTPLVQSQPRSDMLKPVEQWGWQELRDYVVAQIIETHGPFPINSRKEFGIFSRFVKAYGADAGRIAQYAFGPACNGWWRGAPVSVTRFCQGSDAFFADRILEILNSAQS